MERELRDQLLRLLENNSKLSSQDLAVMLVLYENTECRISHVVRGNNNNALVFDTLDEVLLKNPGAQPLFHSDRRFQYTNREFHTKLVNAGITQSMSRGAKCIDNGPMEGF